MIRDHRQLRDQASKYKKLAEMPDRLTKGDILDFVTLLEDAARDMENLTRGPLPGCTCRLIDDDNRCYVIYDPKCHHHRHLEAQRNETAARYAEAAEKLKREHRVPLAAAALQGLLSRSGGPPAQPAEAAVAAADEMLAVLLR
jgi:hypothetical protein